MEKWMEAGQPHAQKKLSEYTIESMKDLPVPEDHEELMRKGDEFIARVRSKS
jgi:hypothetical protein